MAARRLSLVALTLTCFTSGALSVAQDSPLAGIESMIAMRDGVRLYTQIYTPKQRTEPLPIILLRTPYGTGSLNPSRVATALAHLLADGYIIVQQDIRGRFKSEGTFVMAARRLRTFASTSRRRSSRTT
jgi:predicted acyl esterase